MAADASGSTPANAAGIELCYETFGDPSGEPLLFVMGLGAQLVAWDEELLQSFVDRGFYAIRFDNRDVGLSTKVDVGDLDVPAQLLAVMSGGTAEAPYSIADMASDAVGLLDHLGLGSAHVVGASMGGMISQAMAIGFPDRVRTLTSIMSTTGEPDVGVPAPEAIAVLVQPPATNRDEAIAQGIASSRVLSPVHFDEESARTKAAAAYDRCFYPAGMANQLVAILASPPRDEGLAKLAVPTFVVHGEVDPLVTVSGGRRTADLVPGAEFLLLEEMGHDLPPVYWPQIVEGITALASRAAPAPT